MNRRIFPMVGQAVAIFIQAVFLFVFLIMGTYGILLLGLSLGV